VSGGGGRADPGDGPLARVRAAAARMADASARERVAISVAALVASLLVGSVIVVVAGLLATCSRPVTVVGVELVTPAGALCYDPIEVYYQLFVAPFLNPFNLAQTLKELTLLVFAGLSVAVAFRAGLFNIGTQGQLVVGALATALSVLWAAPLVPTGVLGGLVLVPLGLVAGSVAGGLYGAVPGALKAYADANEVITTIMLNFVAVEVVFYLVSTRFQAPGTGTVQTRELPAYARLSPVLPAFERSPFSVLALALALALVLGVFYLLFSTSFGYDLRVSGVQSAAAAYGGVAAERMVVASMALSGALGGLGGAVYVLMVLGRFQTGVPSLGFDGITVSILAGNNPVGVVLAALLFGTMKSGGLNISIALGVPRELVGVLRGLVILFVAMPEFFRLLGRRAGLGSDRDPAAAATDGGRPADDDGPSGRAADDDGPSGRAGAADGTDGPAGGPAGDAPAEEVGRR